MRAPVHSIKAAKRRKLKPIGYHSNTGWLFGVELDRKGSWLRCYFPSVGIKRLSKHEQQFVRELPLFSKPETKKESKNVV